MWSRVKTWMLLPTDMEKWEAESLPSEKQTRETKSAPLDLKTSGAKQQRSNPKDGETKDVAQRSWSKQPRAYLQFTRQKGRGWGEGPRGPPREDWNTTGWSTERRVIETDTDTDSCKDFCRQTQREASGTQLQRLSWKDTAADTAAKTQLQTQQR